MTLKLWVALSFVNARQVSVRHISTTEADISLKLLLVVATMTFAS